ncbi:hypothetical protein ACG2LH_07340 [Zhouia sp. PK063]|uniref:hypothetical protein n=1 Tax=Zhouia sp. PK063 TaxID=3373602 RepID=UPI00379A4DF5
MRTPTMRRFSISACMLMSVVAFAQKQTKHITQKIAVNKDVQVNVNTSYADVEFETWNKNYVEVDATLEMNDATKEKLEEYAKNWNLNVKGDKNEVTISTGNNHHFSWTDGDHSYSYSYRVITPDSLGVSDSIFINMPTPPAPPKLPTPPVPPVAPNFSAPPVPPVPPVVMNKLQSVTFDYERYKKEGDSYLKEWKASFDKNFDGNFKKEMEKWRAEMEKNRAEMDKWRQNFVVVQKAAIDSARQEMEKYRVEISKLREEQSKERAEQIQKIRSKARYMIRDLQYDNSNVKKKIIIKLPKNARLKINVRHGEVKLAENTNIKATLSYSRLFASAVNGDKTHIETSYAPVEIKTWNNGMLSVNYANNVSIATVKDISLSSNSSAIEIGNVSKNADINSSFSKIKINTVLPDFTKFKIHLENSDAILALPITPFKFYSVLESSKVKYPSALQLNVFNNFSDVIAKGFYLKSDTDKEINVSGSLNTIRFINL